MLPMVLENEATEKVSFKLLAKNMKERSVAGENSYMSSLERGIGLE